MLKTRLVILGLILAIASGVGLFFGLLLPRLPSTPRPPTLQNTATLLTQVQNLSELVTVKYVLEKVVVLEDVKWYGENRVLLLAHGVVKAGVDLRKLQPADLILDGSRVQLTLPKATITDIYLDERRTRVIEHSTGLLRAFDENLQAEARRQALDELGRAARQGGIYDDAQTQAQQQLTNLFGQLGLEVEFK